MSGARSARSVQQQRPPHERRAEWTVMDREDMRVGHEQTKASEPCIGGHSCHQCRRTNEEKLSRSTVSERQACCALRLTLDVKRSTVACR